MKPATARHVLGEGADEPDREERAAERGEHPGEDDGPVADPVHGDADGVGGARMLAAGADPQADRRLEEHDVGEDDRREHQPHEQVQVAEDVVEEVADPRDVVEEAEIDVRDSETSSAIPSG